MNELNALLSGIDPTSEIFTLWYEVTFIRKCLNETLIQNGLNLSPGTIDQCRLAAQSEVQNRFPTCKLNFGVESNKVGGES